MKQLYIWGFVFLAGHACAAGESEFRPFTSTDGRSIEARILEYNPSRNKLQIERITGKKIWVEPGIFSEEDRSFIRAWISAQDFLSPTKVRVSIDMKKKSKGRTGDFVHYEITVQNRSSSDLENITFDYRFYVEGKAYRGRQDKDHCLKGTIKLDHLKVGEKTVVQTPVELMKETYESYTESDVDAYGNITYSTYQRKVWDEDARGIWLKIKGPKLEGNPLVR